MYSLNPACYVPSAVAQYIPSSLACPPPPSYFAQTYSALTSPITSTFTSVRTIMDALLSLPALSFLLIPTMTSYSTSLNLLFFYITWSTLVLSHPPLRVEIVASLATRILFYMGPSLFFLLFDTLLPSASASLKALGPTALPLPQRNTYARQNTLRLAKVFAWSVFNTLLGLIIQSATELLFTRIFSIRSALRVTTTLPTPFSIAKDLLRGYLLREILAYTLHRFILHPPDRPNVLSNLHERWYHTEISAPFPMSATYDHPAAYLIRNFLPTYLPAVLFRFHLLTYMVYTAFISLEETFAYSGYSTVPTNFILGGIARRTDNHVLCGGEGNFGPWGLVDWLIGTSVGGDVMHDVVAELK
jgi:Fatty acid hydroxylase superfamily